jgi:hypothetical protein
MMMSTFFAASSTSVSACSFADWKRLNAATRNGKVREAIAERAVVLVRENRRRNEDRDLAIRLHRLERRTNGDLRLAVADIADEQPVHRARLFHVRLDVDGRLALIRRVLEEERRLELALPRACLESAAARCDLSARVEVEQLDGHLLMAARVRSRCCAQRCRRACGRRGGAASPSASPAARYRSIWSMR